MYVTQVSVLSDKNNDIWCCLRLWFLQVVDVCNSIKGKSPWFQHLLSYSMQFQLVQIYLSCLPNCLIKFFFYKYILSCINSSDNHFSNYYLSIDLIQKKKSGFFRFFIIFFTVFFLSTLIIMLISILLCMGPTNITFHWLHDTLCNVVQENM